MVSSLVSSHNRPEKIQQLIDESFEVRVLPLHQLMFDGVVCNYAYWGQSSDYTFNDSNRSARGIKASEIFRELATKDRFAILDLGCGVGGFLHAMKERFSNIEVVGVTAADFRRTRYDKQEFMLPDYEYVVANIENLNQVLALKGKKFDFIVSSVTFRHLSDPLGVLCQAHDLLNENGILLVDDFRLNGIADEFDLLAIMKEAGCHNVEIHQDNSDSIIQIKIRKVGLDRLQLPLQYDIAKSTKATDMNQARVFYSRNVNNP